jgi:2-polyprenyl-3-methyl-5-hydroxy-6-metoxy-1,4-benzoquinol methylase
MRRVNNDIKREFINKWVKPGSKVLDIGCGQGGDLHKWKALNVKLTGIDPNPMAIKEAQKRAALILPSAKFKVGTILDAVYKDSYDVICYNFSIQYEDPKNYKYIKTLLNPGGYLLGITPDKTRFQFAKEEGIIMDEISENKVSVWIPDTPYYKDGPVPEPIIDPEIFIYNMAQIGLDKVLFGESFSIYSKFIFKS